MVLNTKLVELLVTHILCNLLPLCLVTNVQLLCYTCELRILLHKHAHSEGVACNDRVQVLSDLQLKSHLHIVNNIFEVQVHIRLLQLMVRVNDSFYILSFGLLRLYRSFGTHSFRNGLELPHIHAQRLHRIFIVVVESQLAATHNAVLDGSDIRRLHSHFHNW